MTYGFKEDYGFHDLGRVKKDFGKNFGKLGMNSGFELLTYLGLNED